MRNDYLFIRGKLKPDICVIAMTCSGEQTVTSTSTTSDRAEGEERRWKGGGRRGTYIIILLDIISLLYTLGNICLLA